MVVDSPVNPQAEGPLHRLSVLVEFFKDWKRKEKETHAFFPPRVGVKRDTMNHSWIARSKRLLSSRKIMDAMDYRLGKLPVRVTRVKFFAGKLRVEI